SPLPVLISFPTRRSSDLLHHRLIELPCLLAVPGHERGGDAPDFAGCGMRSAPEEHSPDHPRDIRIYGWHRLLVGEARHRPGRIRSEEHTSELQSRSELVC